MTSAAPVRILVACCLLLSAAGCDILETAAEEEGEEFVLTEALLTGKVLVFTNPSPNFSIGEEPEWEYTFVAGTAYGCNPNASYQSTGWSVSGSSIRVSFGSAYENYELRSASGSLQNGTLRGEFHLTSSVPGNVVDGSFRQVTSNLYC